MSHEREEEEAELIKLIPEGLVSEFCVLICPNVPQVELKFIDYLVED